MRSAAAVGGRLFALERSPTGVSAVAAFAGVVDKDGAAGTAGAGSIGVVGYDCGSRSAGGNGGGGGGGGV